MTTWEWVAQAEVLLMAPVVTAFVVLYGVFWPWWCSAQGRALFVAKLGMALLVDLGAAYMLAPQAMPRQDVVAALVYGVILLGQAGLLFALLRAWPARHDARNTRNDDDTEGDNL